MSFPSPAQDYIDSRISLDRTCIVRPSSTYLVRVEEGCRAMGIFPGAILVVDAAVKPVHGSVVIAVMEGAYVIRRLRLYPCPALENLGNPNEMTVMDLDEGSMVIFGVVTFAVNDLQQVKYDGTPGL